LQIRHFLKKTVKQFTLYLPLKYKNARKKSWIKHRALMRYSLKGDVIAHYTNVSFERQREIVEQFPRFDWPIEAMKAAG